MRRTAVWYVSDEGLRRLLDNRAIRLLPELWNHAGVIADRAVTIVCDDGKPEPATACECDTVGYCCAPLGACCRCHTSSNRRPTVDCKCGQPAPATKDRVVEGYGSCDDNGRANFWGPGEHLLTKAPGVYPATMTIHEPAKEPTLYEAVEEYVMSRLAQVPESVVAAFNREKAVREREGRK